MVAKSKQVAEDMASRAMARGIVAGLRVRHESYSYELVGELMGDLEEAASWALGSHSDYIEPVCRTAMGLPEWLELVGEVSAEESDRMTYMMNERAG